MPAAAASPSPGLPASVDGDGAETLFFVHGWPDDEHLWDAQVAHFRGRYRCVRVTMPHYAGRAAAQSLGHKAEGWDFPEAADAVVATIRRECRGRPVTLVIHDWGCVWGFLAQQRAPELVKAIIAMDVGHPATLASGWRNLPAAVAAGIIYQYWLVAAYLVARATAGTAAEARGRAVADGTVHAVTRLATRELRGRYRVDTERITADACYPYFHFQTGWGVRGVAPWDTKAPAPSCPCLYLYGKQKPFNFHSPAWERHLRRRPDCKVVGVPAGHWVMLQQPEFVNRAMEEWLDREAPAPHPRL